jgi:hypothetical protein
VRAGVLARFGCGLSVLAAVGTLVVFLSTLLALALLTGLPAFLFLTLGAVPVFLVPLPLAISLLVSLLSALVALSLIALALVPLLPALPLTALTTLILILIVLLSHGVSL